MSSAKSTSTPTRSAAGAPAPGLHPLRTYGAVLLGVVGVLSFHFLAEQAAWQRWGVFLFCTLLAAAAVLAGGAEHPPRLFLRGALEEARKVVWPERKEALTLTAYVLVFIVVMSLLLLLSDKLLEWLLYDTLLHWGK